MSIAVPSATSITPPNSSLSSIMTQVVNYVRGGSDPEVLGLATSEINTAIDQINQWNWNRLNASQSITVVLSDSDYALSSDVKSPIQLERVDPNSKTVGRVGFKQFQTFLRDHPWRRDSGIAVFYTIDEDSRLLLLDRPPSQSFVDQYPTLKFWYHKRLPHLSSPSAQLDCPPEFQSYIIWEARSAMSAIRGDSARERVAARKALRLWDSLRSDDADTATDSSGMRC